MQERGWEVGGETGELGGDMGGGEEENAVKEGDGNLEVTAVVEAHWQIS